MNCSHEPPITYQNWVATLYVNCHKFAMMKGVALLLLFIQSIVLVLQPLGNTNSLNLRAMYHQCSKEDHDITPLDFVFEHLLNFESIINLFEGESKQEHQHFPVGKSVTHIAVTIPQPLFLLQKAKMAFFEKVDYPAGENEFQVGTFYPEIFHPPIV